MRKILTLRTCAERYIKTHRVSKDNASLIRGRAASLSEFCGGDLLICDLKPEIVDEWLLELMRQGIGEITADCYKRRIINVWKYALRQELNRHTVPRPWPLPKLPAAAEPIEEKPPEPEPLPAYEQRGKRAVVVINGTAHDLGPYDSEDSHVAYERLTAEYDAIGRPGFFGQSLGNLAVGELAKHYQEFADKYYGTGRTQADLVRYSLRPLTELYAKQAAAAFSPIKLQAVRARMVSAGWRRKHCNKCTQIIVRAFRWAASQELVPGSLVHSLESVRGLRAGKTTAPESERVEPIADELVEATVLQLSKVVGAMVEFQRLTGCRPGEVCLLRPCDIDRSGDVWRFKPQRHKTMHFGRERLILIGPKAQAVLRPFLLRPAESYCFSPREAQKEHRRKLTASRKTPLSCGHRFGNNRKENPQRTPGERFTTQSYAWAIRRACRRAKIKGWGPNRLRHSAATEIRKKFGLEAVQVVLGHATADVTQIYAERDYGLAERVALAVG